MLLRVGTRLAGACPQPLSCLLRGSLQQRMFSKSWSSSHSLFLTPSVGDLQLGSEQTVPLLQPARTESCPSTGPAPWRATFHKGMCPVAGTELTRRVPP